MLTYKYTEPCISNQSLHTRVKFNFRNFDLIIAKDICVYYYHLSDSTIVQVSDAHIIKTYNIILYNIKM